MADGAPPMRLVLVGEVRSADAALRGMLARGFSPLAVVTTEQGARTASAGMALEYYGALGAIARAEGIPVRVIADLNAEVGLLRSLAPDWVFVLGWPYMVRAAILDTVRCIGMHPTRLPARRGGAPLNWLLLDGETTSAVSLLRLRAGVDDGEILAQRDFPIHEEDYVGDVLERVCRITHDLVAESVVALAAGTAVWRQQRDDLATYTRRRRPEDGRMVWNDSAVRIRNLVRAVSRPFPGAFTHVKGCELRVWRAELPLGYRAPLGAAPGTILGADACGVFVCTRDNALLVTEAQPADAPVLSGTALARWCAPWVGRVFE